MTATRPAGDSLRTSTAANLVAQALGPLSGLVLIPVYLTYLGVAGYGLVALLTSLLAFSGVFTRGIGWSLQREVAQAAAAGDDKRTASLVKSFEVGFLVVGVLLGSVLAAAAPWLSGVLEGDGLSSSTVLTCLLILGGRMAVLFPGGVYQATLLGSRRQLQVNLVNSTGLLLTSAVLVVTVIATRSLVAFYVADLVCALAVLLFLRARARAVAPSEEEAAWLTRSELRSLTALTAGLSWTHAVGLVTRQLDRIVVGAVTSLASLGIYSAGAAGGRLLMIAYNPFLTAVFPRSCALARDRPERMPDHLVRNSQVVTLLSFGVGVPVALSAGELLDLWLSQPQVVAGATPVLVLYVVGNLWLSLADTQAQTHTALGTSRCGVLVNTAAAVWLPVTLLLLVRETGIVGAAITWLVYAVTTWLWFTGYTFFVLMRGQLRRYLLAVLRPALAVTLLDLAASVCARSLAGGVSPVQFLAVMIPASAVALAATAILVLGHGTVRQLLSRDGRGSATA